MNITFIDFIKIHSEKLYNYFSNSKLVNYKGSSTERVMKSRLKQLELRYDAIQQVDNSSEQKALLHFLAANQSFEENDFPKAIKRLKQSEQLAKSTNNYFLLSQIYSKKVIYTDQFSELNFDKLYQDIQNNQEKLKQYQSRQALFAEVKRHFIKFLHQEEEQDLESIIESALSEYTSNLEEVLDSAAIFQLITMLDSIGTVNHKFGSLDLFFEPRLEFIIQEEKINGNLVESLYLMANIALRSASFKNALHYLNLFSEKAAKLKNYQWQGRYHFLKSLVHCFQGKLENAFVEVDMAFTFSKKDDKNMLNAQLAKCLYLLLSNEYKLALSLWNQMHQSNQFYIKIMGREWLIYKQIMGIILMHERQNSDLAESWLQILSKKHKAFLNQKSSVGVYAYIKIVKRIIDGHNIQPQQLDDYFDLHFKNIDQHNSDVFLVSFYTWIKAKVYKKDVYNILIELVNSNIN